MPCCDWRGAGAGQGRRWGGWFWRRVYPATAFLLLRDSEVETQWVILCGKPGSVCPTPSRRKPWIGPSWAFYLWISKLAVGQSGQQISTKPHCEICQGPYSEGRLPRNILQRKATADYFGFSLALTASC